MMSEEARKALKQLIRHYTQNVTANHETARREAIAEGFSTETGELTPEYGGEPLRRLVQAH